MAEKPLHGGEYMILFFIGFYSCERNGILGTDSQY